MLPEPIITRSPSLNSVVNDVLDPVTVEEESLKVTVPDFVVNPLFEAPTSIQ